MVSCWGGGGGESTTIFALGTTNTKASPDSKRSLTALQHLSAPESISVGWLFNLEHQQGFDLCLQLQVTLYQDSFVQDCIFVVLWSLETWGFFPPQGLKDLPSHWLVTTTLALSTENTFMIQD